MFTNSFIKKQLDFSEDARRDERYLKQKYADSWEVKFIESKKTDTQGFILLNRSIKTLRISFRGTQQLRDWATDFNAFHMVYPYGNDQSKIRVHRGIYQAYLSVRNKIHNYVIPNLDCINSMYIAGHSLGGALSTFCAVDMQYNFILRTSMLEIMGFASGNPKVGNRAFVKSFNRRCPKFVTTYKRNDWVPYLPPKWFGGIIHGGYHKAGMLNPIGKRCFSLGILNWFVSKRKLNNLLEHTANHTIDMYRADL
jgi:predicted lipase